MKHIWRLFWHGFRVGHGGRCGRCGGAELDGRIHPRGMWGRGGRL